MKRISRVLFNMAVMSAVPAVAGAVGTYYNGNLYQNPQSRYNGGYYNNYGAGRGYGQNDQAMVTRNSTTKVTKKSVKKSQADAKQGFRAGLDITHEFAGWNFEMKNAGSRLHYDDLRWNVISGNAAYYFGDSLPMQVRVGAKYGKQFGDSAMVDDDITNGGYIVDVYGNDDYGGTWGYQTEHALSLGTSKDGTQTGFNVAFGLTDFFKWGKVKITPSVGYRYFKYELETKQNYGITMDIFEATDNHDYITCIAGEGGEIQCDPFLLWYLPDGVTITGHATDEDGYLYDNIEVPSGATSVNVGGSYYYQQAGTSHKYKTSWAGPYLALDMEYAIDNDNLVNAGIELGLPVYKTEGDQPYRPDWLHPKSVEDKGDLGDAWHLALNGNWSTALSDSVMLSLGVTYDYYHVKDATAKTFLNAAYYEALLDNGYISEEDFDEYKSQGWVLESKSEVESVYKSMGFRLGLNVKF